MTSMADRITGGVDTHLDVHVAAALNQLGALLETKSFPTTAAGYRQLLGWLRGFGEVELVGVEGTGSYGAGLTRHLLSEGVAVVEVDRPNRQNRRRRGKSDTVDAVAAARAAQSGDASGAAKTRDGNVECMRVLRLVKLSARRNRTVALNQMRAIVATGPEELRPLFRDVSVHQLVERAAALRPGARSRCIGLNEDRAAPVGTTRPGLRRGDGRDQPTARAAGCRHRTRALELCRRRHRRGQCPARRRRRQPRATAVGADLRPPLRRLADRRVVGQERAPPIEPLR